MIYHGMTNTKPISSQVQNIFQQKAENIWKHLKTTRLIPSVVQRLSTHMEYPIPLVELRIFMI